MGGGLAGIAAAFGLAETGRRVLLLERRPFLGGRAFSFRDPDSEAVIDNGQHVLVGACGRLRALLERIGSSGSFARQPRLAVPLLDSGGRRAILRSAPLPPPLHLVPALLGYRHLDLRDRWAVGRAIRDLVGLGARERAALDRVPLGTWLATRGAAPGRAIEGFWEPLVRPALNVAARGANLPLTTVFLEKALWNDPAAGALWLPTVGLGDAIGTPAARALTDAGIEVRTGVRATGLAVTDGTVTGLRTTAGDVAARSVVAAIPPRALDRLLPDGTGPDDGYAAIGSSPIVNAYLWYDRPIMDAPFVGAIGSEAEWIFDRTRLLGADAAGGECIGISLSAAGRWVGRSKAEIADRLDAALDCLFPRKRTARRLRFAVVKEPRATFLAGPDLASRRPGPEGPLSGLVLAGDWTATGWPATMEGAVLSGETAARAVESIA